MNKIIIEIKIVSFDGGGVFWVVYVVDVVDGRDVVDAVDIIDSSLEDNILLSLYP